jgi:hypothetical protein
MQMTIYDDLLVADFNECFEQMRHYDAAFMKRLDFGFTGIITVIGATAFLIEHFTATRFILSLSGLLLGVSSLAGIMLVWSLARNRVYFATVARYVNEIRALYLSHHPGGVTNKSGIYSDYNSPKIFSPASSQSIDIYFLAICVSVLISGAVTSLNLAYRMVSQQNQLISWRLAVLVFVGSFVVLVLSTAAYWYIEERKKRSLLVVNDKSKPSTVVNLREDN